MDKLTDSSTENKRDFGSNSNIEYEQHVLSYLIRETKKEFRFKTEEEARKYLFIAVGHDTVVSRIFYRILDLKNNPKKFMEIEKMIEEFYPS